MSSRHRMHNTHARSKLCAVLRVTCLNEKICLANTKNQRAIHKARCQELASWICIQPISVQCNVGKHICWPYAFLFVLIFIHTDDTKPVVMSSLEGWDKTSYLRITRYIGDIISLLDRTYSCSRDAAQHSIQNFLNIQKVVHRRRKRLMQGQNNWLQLQQRYLMYICLRLAKIEKIHSLTLITGYRLNHLSCGKMVLSKFRLKSIYICTAWKTGFSSTYVVSWLRINGWQHIPALGESDLYYARLVITSSTGWSYFLCAKSLYRSKICNKPKMLIWKEMNLLLVFIGFLEDVISSLQAFSQVQRDLSASSTLELEPIVLNISQWLVKLECSIKPEFYSAETCMELRRPLK